MIKIKLTTSVLWVSAALVAAPQVSAQEGSGTPLPGSLDFLEVTAPKVYTSHVLADGTPQEWTGEGLHAGIQVFSFTLQNYKDIPEDFEIPANPTSYCTISDFNGNVVASRESDMTSTFKMIKFSKKFQKASVFNLGVNRGGKYRLTGGLSPDLYTFTQEIILNDKPGAQVVNSTVKVDEGLNPKVTITSGFPYNPETIAGEHSLHWTVSAASDPSKVIAENTETFVLSSESESLAAIAELYLTVPDAEPGEYLFTLASDYAPANRTFTAKVYDVVHPEISLDKAQYVLGVDKEAILSVEMRCRYPYIALDAATEEHTVTVNPILLEQSNPVNFSNPAWADSEMNFREDIRIPLDNVTTEDLTEYHNRLPLRVVISFNGQAQYDGTLEVAFEKGSSGIDSVNTDPKSSEVKYYNAFGLEVDENYRGMVITSNGDKFFKY